MNKFIKLAIIALSFCGATFINAASINQSFADGSSSPDLGVVKGSGLAEGSSVSVGGGDTIAFSLNYNLNEGPAASNLVAFLEDLRGRTFTTGSSETVTGRITSSNYDNSSGSVSVSFTEDVQLVWSHTSWQKQNCSSYSCESSLLGNSTAVLGSSGLSLGNVTNTSNDYKGGLVVEFTVNSITYDDCSVNGTTVAHGSSRTFYSSQTTSGSCSAIDQSRTCNDGTLSGSNSYQFTTCSTETPTYDDCSVNGTTVAHGSSRTFYSSQTTSGSCSAIDQSRTCNDGTLSGSNSYQFTTCSTETPTYDDCSVNGTTVAHGSSRTFYSSQTTSGSCSAIDQSRTCNDGTLSGSNSYQFTTCSTETPTYDDCSVNGTTVAHGSSRTFYSSQTTSGSCSAIDRIRYCNDGSLSGEGSFIYTGCSTETPTYDDCSVNGTTVAHGSSRTFYSSQTTSGSCSAIDRIRYCNDGSLSGEGSFIYTGCSTETPTYDDCSVNGTTVAHGSSRTFYSSQTTSGSCSAIDQSRTCNDGNLSGSSNYTFANCATLFVTPTVTRAVVETPRRVVQEKPQAVKQVASQPVEKITVTKWVSTQHNPKYEVRTEALPGETVYYKIQVRNNTEGDLENVEIIDRIPFYLELDSTSSNDDDNDKQIRWVLDMKKDESKIYVTEMRVREDADFGESIYSFASASAPGFDHESNQVKITVVESHESEFIDENVITSGNDGYGWWSWWWLVFIVLFLIIVRFLMSVHLSQQRQKLLIARLKNEKEQRNL